MSSAQPGYSMAFRALIVDDREPVRQQLMAAAVTNGFDVIGQSASLATLLRDVQEQRPDIVLLDLHLSGDPLTLVPGLILARPGLLVVATSSFQDIDLMQRAFDAGVHRCLRKPLRVDEIHRVLENLIEELNPTIDV